MPPVSQAQRRLMWAASARQGGVDGVPQSVGKDFANADLGGKLPAKKKSKGSVLYDNKKQ